MQITRYEEVYKGAVIANFDVLLSCGVELHKLLLLRGKEGKPFFKFPAQKFRDLSGRWKFKPYISIPDTDIWKAFTSEVMESLEALMNDEPPPLPISGDGQF